MGPAGATALVVGSMLGVGILLTPPLVARAVDSPAAFFALWAAGGAVSLCGAAVYAELGTLLPRGGGDVVFQRAAFGRPLASASGVVVFAVSFAASIAAMAVAVGTYQASTLLSVASGGAPVDTTAALAGLGLSPATLVGLGLIGLTTAINLIGARVAAGLQAVLTLVPVLTLGGMALAVFAGVPVEAPAATAAPPPVGLVEAWLAVYFTYAGWPTVVYVAGEVRDPGRILGRATVGGTAMVTALYLLVGAALLAAFGLDGLATIGESGTALARALLGPQAEVLMAGLVAIAITASINGTVLAGARIAAAMAEQGALPAALARRSGAGAAPRVALLVQAALASLYVLSGSFESILAASGVAMMLIGALTVAAAVRLRMRDPQALRPFRVPALPVVAGLFILVSVLVVGGSLRSAAASGGVGVPLIGVGVLGVAWAVFRFRERRVE